MHALLHFCTFSNIFFFYILSLCMLYFILLPFQTFFKYSFNISIFTPYTYTVEPRSNGHQWAKKMWPYQRGFFLKKMYGGFCQAAKKSGRNNEVAVRRGSTVYANSFNFLVT